MPARESIRAQAAARTAAVETETPPVPTWFSGEGRPLFGWIHLPKGTTRNCGVVLCNPFGHDAMCAHRAYRDLAERLADAGFPAIRFDYDGTGDSAGSSDDPARVESWLQSIEAAIDELKAWTGVPHIALFGLRLGGLLASTVAARRPIDALALFGCPPSGKVYLRELRAMQGLQREARTPNSPDGESLGYAIDPTTRANLALLDAASASGGVAARTLVISRDGMASSDERLVKALGARGSEVRSSTTPGYAALMQDDPYKCEIPVDVWREVVAWLESAYPTRAAIVERTRAPRTVATVASEAGVQVRESLVQIGHLFGILAEPINANSDRPAIVVLNTGANHHVGNNRMYVPFARDGATAGFRVMRFDFTGIGDSARDSAIPADRIYSNECVTEVKSVLDYLEAERGARRFVLMGLCSGAYVAYHTAVAEPRVSAIVIINLLTFHWRHGDSLDPKVGKRIKSTAFYRRTVFDSAVWKRALKGEIELRQVLSALATRGRTRARVAISAVVGRLAGSDASTTDVVRTIRGLCARGTDVTVVCGADNAEEQLIEEHLGARARRLRKERRFHLDIIEATDHTMTPLSAQRELRDILRRRVFQN